MDTTNPTEDSSLTADDAAADDTPATPAPHTGPEDVPADPTRVSDSAHAPGDYKRTHQGRQMMDRWMLHKTFMEDLEVEIPAEDTSSPLSPPSPTPAPDKHPDQR